MYDVAIIGAGVVGASIARQLAKYKLKIALIDAADDVGMGASRANSAIVHAGYDCAPGSSEARLNVRGNYLFTEWCAELNVPLERVGSLVIGFDDEDGEVIEGLYRRGVQNGVEGMEIIGGARARDMEPALSPEVTRALYAPTAGITCPYQLTVACAENARANGCEWHLGASVSGIERSGDDRLVVHTSTGDIESRYVVNAAGVFADDIAGMVGDHSFSVRPRKGEYVLIDRSATDVGMVIFQTPSRLGKGVLVSPTVDGNMFAGPTAVDQQDKLDTTVTDAGIDELARMSHRSVPGIDFRSSITSFAGVRAQPSTGDFIIRASDSCPRMIHAAGICSPGLTSAPAIAEEVEGLIYSAGLALEKDPNYNPIRLPIPEFRHMTDDEKRAAIARDPRYGRMICRCETVTEAEIVEAIHRGAHTLDGVKRRTRAGMGRCQSGFCGPRVMEIISRETGIPMTEITKFGGRSYMLAGETGGAENV